MVFILISFIIGLILGSFGNVLIYRIPKRISIVFPNSFCPNCNFPIKWYDNIPILSFFLLKGRCRNCKNKISFLYPLVEFLCGVLCVLLYLKFGFLKMWIFLNFFFILLVISIIDIKTTEIPDELSYYLIFSGIIFSIFNPFIGRHDIFIRITNSAIGGLTGFFISYLIAITGEKIFRKTALGGGDIKLFTSVGIWLGYEGFFKIVFLSSFLGLVFIVLLSIYKKKTLWGSYLQFGPFISLGCFLYVFLN
ncbi:MAG: prepilin peptidase [Endomicrobiia bacterium]